MGRGGKGDREKRKITRGGECANGSRGKTGGEGSKSVVAWLFRRILPQKCLMTISVENLDSVTFIGIALIGRWRAG
jgi:hypothetical protein